MRALLAALAVAILAVPAAAQSIDCAAPACDQVIEPACLQRLGAGSVAAADDACAAQQQAYVACLSAVAEQCGAPADPAAGSCSAADARQMFEAAIASEDPAELEAFAEACPAAPQARLARLRAESLRAAAGVGRTQSDGSNGPAFAGDWRVERLISRTSERYNCIDVVRIQANGEAWLYGFRAIHQTHYQTAPATGARDGARLVFDNGASFELDGDRLIFATAQTRCAYLRLVSQ